MRLYSCGAVICWRVGCHAWLRADPAKKSTITVSHRGVQQYNRASNRPECKAVCRWSIWPNESVALLRTTADGLGYADRRVDVGEGGFSGQDVCSLGPQMTVVKCVKPDHCGAIYATCIRVLVSVEYVGV